MSDLTEWSIEWVIDWLQKEFDSKNNSKLHVNKSLSVNKPRRGKGGELNVQFDVLLQSVYCDPLVFVCG